MKKRLISMLMAVLMIASLLPAAALAEAPATDTHEHKYTTVSIKKDADVAARARWQTARVPCQI